MPADRYLAEIVAHALESQHRNKLRRLEEHLDTMASHIVSGTTAEQMEAALHIRIVDDISLLHELRR
jgi:hypothetical protein